MPPKKKVATTYLLKFKNKRTTYVIPIEQSGLTVDKLRSTLLNTINESGGLQQEGIEDDIVVPKSEFEDDIPVPKSEFEDDVPIPKSEFDDEMKIEDNQVIKPELEMHDLRIAIPRDVTQPYDNQWIEINTDDQIEEIQFKDYLIFAFSTDDNFNIIEAAYDEQ